MPLVAPQIHVVVNSGNAPTELQRIVTLAQLNMFKIVQLAADLGVTQSGDDIDIIPLVGPAGFQFTVNVTRDLVPRLIQLTGYAAAALADDEYASLSTMRGYFNFAPLKYRFDLRDPPLPPYAEWNPYFVPFFPTLTDYSNAAVAHVMARRRDRSSRIVIIADTQEIVDQLTRTVHHHQGCLH